MAIANYCQKCAVETPTGESCPYCGGKLSKTNERFSFGVTRRPVRDWFEWNRYLRVGLPVLGVIFLAAVLGEGFAAGGAGVLRLFQRGFAGTMLALLAGLLLIVFALLWLQGVENVHYVLDREGVKAYTYLRDARPFRLYARFLTPAAVRGLAEEKHALPGLTLVRRTILPWEALRRVRVWREGSTLLFFRPAFWQVLAAVCPVFDLPQAEAWVRAKVKRYKTVQVLPRETRPKRANKK